MPLVRYFYFVGGVLLALLFIFDACLPIPPVAEKVEVYLPVIRIHSGHKWPERIVYDTSLPTPASTSIASTDNIIQAPEPIVDASAGSKEKQAFAMLPSSADRLQASNVKKPEPKPQHHRKAVRKRAPVQAPMFAMARQQQFGWFGRNFW